MIGLGLIILLLSIMNYETLVTPIQTTYLQASTHNVQKIEIYNQYEDDTKYLFSLDTNQQINTLLDILHDSTPHSN